MKLLWITNIILPFPSKEIGHKITNFGGWVSSILNEIRQDQSNSFCIVTVYNNKKLKKIIDGNVIYYLIPGKIESQKYNKNYWHEIVNDFMPDLVHLHGSEFPIGLSFLKEFPEITSVLSIQGLVSVCEREYLASLSISEIFHNITFRDVIKNDNIFQQKKKFEIRGFIEKDTIMRVNAVIGRTKWDYSCAKAINSNVKYYKNDEILRDCFYFDKWDIKNVKMYTIYISQANYPIKGFHVFLDALYLVKQKYPEVKVYVGGQNICKYENIEDKIKLSGYGKIIRNKIKNLNLEDNIIFLGIISDEEVKKVMLTSHIFVLPSKLENSSNSLGESLSLGLPVIASFVGGTPSLISDGVEGLLYSYEDYEMLANLIMELFRNEKLCKKISEKGRSKAKDIYNVRRNSEELIRIYRHLVEKKDK